MEKDSSTQKIPQKCLKKLKAKNANNLLIIFVHGFVEMKKEISDIYKKLIKKWYNKTLTYREKKQIDIFTNFKIEKLEVNEKTVNIYIAMYKQIKNLIQKQYYIEIAGVKVMRENLRAEGELWGSAKFPLIFSEKEEVLVKVNFDGDIWEFTEGDNKWDQLFTFEAAKRVVEKQWLRMLEDYEWKKILKDKWWNISSEQTKKLTKKLNIHLCGYGRTNFGIYDFDKGANFWLPDNTLEEAWCMRFIENKWSNNRLPKIALFSVRCVYKE